MVSNQKPLRLRVMLEIFSTLFVRVSVENKRNEGNLNGLGLFRFFYVHCAITIELMFLGWRNAFAFLFLPEVLETALFQNGHVQCIQQ